MCIRDRHKDHTQALLGAAVDKAAGGVGADVGTGNQLVLLSGTEMVPEGIAGF